jgi:hypothetical protein
VSFACWSDVLFDGSFLIKVMSGIFSILLVLVHALFEEPPHEVESKQPLRTLLKVVKLVSERIDEILM